MNTMEVIKLINQMIDNTKYIKRKTKVIYSKTYDTIDKNNH